MTVILCLLKFIVFIAMYIILGMFFINTFFKMQLDAISCIENIDNMNAKKFSVYDVYDVRNGSYISNLEKKTNLFSLAWPLIMFFLIGYKLGEKYYAKKVNYKKDELIASWIIE